VDGGRAAVSARRLRRPVQRTLAFDDLSSASLE
jgi:hypothetical protein